jgi:hypothetical protein
MIRWPYFNIWQQDLQNSFSAIMAPKYSIFCKKLLYVVCSIMQHPHIAQLAKLFPDFVRFYGPWVFYIWQKALLNLFIVMSSQYFTFGEKLLLRYIDYIASQVFYQNCPNLVV